MENILPILCCVLINQLIIVECKEIPRAEPVKSEGKPEIDIRRNIDFYTGKIDDKTLKEVLHSDLTLQDDLETIVSTFYSGLFKRRNPTTQGSPGPSLPHDNGICCRAYVSWNVPEQSDLIHAGEEYQPVQFGDWYQGYNKAHSCRSFGCEGSCVKGYTSMSFLVYTSESPPSLAMMSFDVPTYCKCVRTKKIWTRPPWTRTPVPHRPRIPGPPGRHT